MTSPEIDTKRIWTVEARSGPGEHWTVWSAWVDRATALVEEEHAIEEGYQARIRRAR